MLPAGKLNTRMELQQETRAPNGRGGYTTAWTKVIDIWAWKRPMRGDEVQREGILRSVAFSRIVIRHLSGVTTQHRLVERNMIWNIRSVDDPDGRRERLELVCEGSPTD